MRALSIGLLAVGLAGCAAGTGDGDAGAPGVFPPVPMACNAAAAQYHVSHDATQAMGEAILKDSGARTLRWGPPNAAWTMDYRQDRVNVRYDERMKIVEITCG